MDKNIPFMPSKALSRQTYRILASSHQSFAGVCPEFHCFLRRGVPFASAVIPAPSVNTRGWLSAVTKLL